MSAIDFYVLTLRFDEFTTPSAVFADWMEERGHTQEAAWLRGVWNKAMLLYPRHHLRELSILTRSGLKTQPWLQQ